jgi:hypothetical protein
MHYSYGCSSDRWTNWPRPTDGGLRHQATNWSTNRWGLLYKGATKRPIGEPTDGNSRELAALLARIWEMYLCKKRIFYSNPGAKSLTVLALINLCYALTWIISPYRTRLPCCLRCSAMLSMFSASAAAWNKGGRSLNEGKTKLCVQGAVGYAGCSGIKPEWSNSEVLQGISFPHIRSCRLVVSQ